MLAPAMGADQLQGQAMHKNDDCCVPHKKWFGNRLSVAPTADCCVRQWKLILETGQGLNSSPFHVFFRACRRCLHLLDSLWVAMSRREAGMAKESGSRETSKQTSGTLFEQTPFQWPEMLCGGKGQGDISQQAWGYHLSIHHVLQNTRRTDQKAWV